MSSITETLQAGIEHHRAGRLRDAEQMYRRVLTMHPRNATAVHMLGLVAYQIGKDQEAIEHIRAAMELDRFNGKFPADLAEIYRALGQLPEATEACRRALELNPENAEVYLCLGHVHRVQGEPDAAASCFRQAIDLNPRSAGAHASLGSILRHLGQLPEALPSFERAVQLDPQSADHYLALGVCLYDVGRLQDAIACYQKSLRLAPDSIKARYDTALARLALGDYVNGWNEFETRHAFGSLVRRRYSLPLWDANEPAGGPVLIHAEQGFGDALQFVRYVPLVAARTEVVLDVHPELLELLSQSGFRNLRCDGVAPPECRRQMPLLSLPRVLGTTLETIPASVPYLHVGEQAQQRWRARLAPLGPLRVGICWAGNPDYYKDYARSIALEQFAPLAKLRGVRLIGLQTGAARAQLAQAAAAGFEVVDLREELADFVDTAAAIKNLHLVITCDTAVAHLAGGLGAPVWVALSHAPDWRWMRDRTDSPWYPTMQLFRQSRYGEWPEVFARMASQLASLAGSAGPAR